VSMSSCKQMIQLCMTTRTHVDMATWLYVSMMKQ